MAGDCVPHMSSCGRQKQQEWKMGFLGGRSLARSLLGFGFGFGFGGFLKPGMFVVLGTAGRHETQLYVEAI